MKELKCEYYWKFRETVSGKLKEKQIKFTQTMLVKPLEVACI